MSSGLVFRFRISDILWLRSLRLSVSIIILITHKNGRGARPHMKQSSRSLWCSRKLMHL
jgi:hypothetical protein